MHPPIQQEGAAVPFASGKLSEAQDEKDDGADEENVNGSSGDGEESSTEGSLTEQEVCNATGEVEIIMEAPNNLSQSDLSLAGTKVGDNPNLIENEIDEENAEKGRGDSRSVSEEDDDVDDPEDDVW
ncbi:hypothetical protein U1Q18_036436 [Sarracenia purpurea var. burkii]